MADIVARINRAEKVWNLVGFVSAYGDRVGEELAGLPVLELHDALKKYSDALLVPEYDWPKKAEIPPDRLATLIDPSVFVSRTARIGKGCIIYPNCYVGAHARIGDFLFCLGGSVINHDDVIEDQVTLTSGVMLAGEVHIESDCYLGQSCTVREKVRIGRASLIGMGSVVLHDVPPNAIMIGNPARRLGARERNYPGKHVVRAARRVVGTRIRAIRRKWTSAKAMSS